MRSKANTAAGVSREAATMLFGLRISARRRSGHAVQVREHLLIRRMYDLSTPLESTMTKREHAQEIYSMPKTPRQDPRWPYAHMKLKRLYTERVPSGMTQEEFGNEYGIGTQGAVWQYLNGYAPLNVEAAAKFAKGLRCTIHDISPEMATMLERDLLPVLGAKMLRAALGDNAAGRGRRGGDA
jgi:hypothetical protein